MYVNTELWKVQNRSLKMLIGLQILEEQFLKIHDQNKKGRPTYGLQ